MCTCLNKLQLSLNKYDSLQKQVNNLMHSCAQLNEDGKLNTNSSNVQLINLAFAQTDLQRDLDTTRKNFLATKSALEVSISQLLVLTVLNCSLQTLLLPWMKLRRIFNKLFRF